MSEVVISMNGIEKSYGKHKVLENVDIDIYKGDIFGIVGKNGAGKTTMFKILLGLSDYQGGTLSIENESEVRGKGNLTEARKKIGFFIGINFFSYMTAKQNIDYYRRLKGIKDQNETKRVLKEVELDKVKIKFGNFSLGMKQRLGIAQALLGDPEIMILDEPTNGLDPQGIVDVRNLIQRLNREKGMTIVISSHILGELQNTAHRFAMLNNGRIMKVVTQKDLTMHNKAVRVSVDDLDNARKVLSDAGIQILSETMETESLEDYYFDLLNGVKGDHPGDKQQPGGDQPESEQQPEDKHKSVDEQQSERGNTNA